MSTPIQSRPSTHRKTNTAHSAVAADPSILGSEDELRRELEYTRDVLRRYREYVQVNYDKKLQEAAEEAELLRQETADLRLENDDLKKQITELRDQAHRSAHSQDQASKEVRAELGRVLDQHTQHVAALNSAHKQELERATNKIRELESEVTRLRTLSDPDALRREASSEAQRKISLLERQLDAERTQHANTMFKLQQSEGAKQALTNVQKQIRTALSNVHDLALDSQETSAQLGVGLAHAGVDAVSADDLSGGWQKALAVCKLQMPKQENEKGAADDSAEALAVLNQTLLASLLEVRRAVASERSGISRGVRQLLGDKEAAEIELQRKEAVFQNELQLFQRRMTELEEDRYAEHHAANTAADRQRHMELLTDPRGGVRVGGDNDVTIVGSSGSVASGIAPSRSQLMAAASGDGSLRGNLPDTFASPASMAPYYGQPRGGVIGSNITHRRTIAVQTGVELMQLTQPSHSQSNEHSNRPSRLIAELEETQEQLTRAREVVRLLDMQRQQFMYFVDDAQLEEDVARALGAGSVSTADFVNLSGRRFVQHSTAQ